MLNKYYVALRFKNDTSLYRSIDTFKKRFDVKYQSISFPNMSLLAPFRMEDGDEINLLETLKEELQTFFYGLDNGFKVGFSSLDVQKHHKKDYIFLNPTLSEDTDFCIELVQSVCEGFIPRALSYKPNTKQLFQLASFSNEGRLAEAMDDLKGQALTGLEMQVDSIVLLKKQKNGDWTLRDELIKFNNEADKVLAAQFLSA